MTILLNYKNNKKLGDVWLFGHDIMVHDHVSFAYEYPFVYSSS